MVNDNEAQKKAIRRWNNLLPYASVGRQSERPNSGFELPLCCHGVAAIAAGHRSDLDVELLGLLVVEV